MDKVQTDRPTGGNQGEFQGGGQSGHSSTIRRLCPPGLMHGPLSVPENQSQTGAVAVKPEMLARFLARPFEIPLELGLPAGALFVRVGVLDRTPNKVGTLEIPVTVAKTVRTAVVPHAPDKPK